MCVRVCGCACVCVRVCTCGVRLRTYLCGHVCVCVYVRACVCGGKEKHVLADMPGFCGSVVCEECFPRVHNDN